MKLFILDPSGNSSLILDESNPWNHLVLEMKKVKQVHSPNEAQFFLINNLTSKSTKFARRYCSPSNSALLMWESAVTCPRNFNTKLHKYFRLILSPSPIWSLKVGAQTFDWPQNNPQIFDITKNTNSSMRLNKWVMVQSKKFSFAKNELYFLRNELLNSQEEELDLWGFGWEDLTSKRLLINFLNEKSLNFVKLFDDIKFNRRVPKNYKGSSSNKIQTMSNYRFSIVVENSMDYVSEKLIDAIIAGTIPVYVGPHLDDFGIPHEIAVRSNPNVSDIRHTMSEVENDMHLQKRTLQAGFSFLDSKEFKSMINVNVFKKLGNILNERLIHE